MHMTGLSKARLLKMAQAKEVEAQLVDGTWRFNPADLEIAEVPEEDMARDRLQQMLAQAQQHIQVLTKQISEPTDKMLKLLLQENENLRKRINTLEDKHLTMLEAYEHSVSLEHERALQRETEQRKAERIDRNLAQFWEWVPKFGSMVIGRRKVQSVIDELDDEKIQFLIQMEMIDPAMGEALKMARSKPSQSTTTEQSGQQPAKGAEQKANGG